MAAKVHGYRYDRDLETRLEHFTRAFLSVPQSFNFAQPSARRFLEKARGAREPSKKGAEVLAEIGRYRLGMRVLENAGAVVGAIPYEGAKAGWNDAIVGDCFLDDPFAYVLEYKNPDDTWQVIALAAARPNFSDGVLEIDQLQGNGKMEVRLTPEAKKARARFNTATCIPFEAMRILALRAGLKKIGLRKPEENFWTWKEKSITDRNSPYRTVASRFHMSEGEGKFFLMDVTEKSEVD